jgi:hypothetical protein
MNMSNLFQASHQWASRPADQRFLSLLEMRDFAANVREHSSAKCVSSRSIAAVPIESDTKALTVIGPNGGACNLTHWSFGQLAQRAGAPAGYLRDLPAPLAADCINFGLQFSRSIEDLGVLVYKNGGPTVLSAVTGPNYGRVWNLSVIDALISKFGDGVNGHFRVPGEFGQRVEVTKDNTTLYASDRDMFVFLADEERRIEVPFRRNGVSGALARGFFMWNSEVGSTTYGLAAFLFDYACRNRIVWGAQGYQEIRIRHTASAPDRFVEEVTPAIEAYSSGSTNDVVKAITNAQAEKIGNAEAVTAFLAKRFSRPQVAAIQAAHMADEQRPIETLWDATTAVTAYARGISHQNERVALEREGGKILELAA